MHTAQRLILAARPNTPLAPSRGEPYHMRGNNLNALLSPKLFENDGEGLKMVLRALESGGEGIRWMADDVGFYRMRWLLNFPGAGIDDIGGIETYHRNRNGKNNVVIFLTGAVSPSDPRMAADAKFRPDLILSTWSDPTKVIGSLITELKLLIDASELKNRPEPEPTRHPR